MSKKIGNIRNSILTVKIPSKKKKKDYTSLLLIRYLASLGDIVTETFKISNSPSYPCMEAMKNITPISFSTIIKHKLSPSIVNFL